MSKVAEIATKATTETQRKAATVSSSTETQSSKPGQLPLPRKNEASNAETVNAEHHRIAFNLGLGIRYHMARQAFFERWHRITGVLSLVGGSAAAVTIAAEYPTISQYAAALVALSQALDLMCNVRSNGDLHSQLRQRYIALESELNGTQEISHRKLLKVNRELKRIEMEEPPIKKRLLDLCHNESLEAAGYKRGQEGVEYVELGVVSRFLANWL